MNIDQAIRAMLADMKAAGKLPTSLQSYEAELRHFERFIGVDVDVRSIGHLRCREYIDMFAHLESSTRALKHTKLTRMFSTLVFDEVIETNPMDKVRRPKTKALKDRKRVRITTEEFVRVLSHCHEWRDRLCIALFCTTAVRRNAAAMIRWSDVDCKKWQITVLEKGNKRAQKAINPYFRKVISNYLMHRAVLGDPVEPDEWFIPSANGNRTKPRSNRVAYLIVKRVTKQAKVKAHCHSLRAAFAVYYLERFPGEIESLRQIMGHESIATTQHYLSELDAQRALRSVDDLDFEMPEAA